jgi:hypothetical protein
MNAVTDEELLARAREFYDQQLKGQLEPRHNAEYVAIDPDAGLWAVGPDPVRLHDELRGQGSEGLLVLLRVGYEWTVQMLGRW